MSTLISVNLALTSSAQIIIIYFDAGMAELADAQASGACGGNIVWVQVPFPAVLAAYLRSKCAARRALSHKVRTKMGEPPCCGEPFRTKCELQWASLLFFYYKILLHLIHKRSLTRLRIAISEESCSYRLISIIAIIGNT